MTHVVTEACIQCKYTDCVEVCPVNCFKVDDNFLVIDPDEFIDCAVRIPECPVSAIYAADKLSAHLHSFTVLNEELAPQWNIITKRKGALPIAELWKDRTGKLAHLDR